jgi:amidase
MNAEALAYMSIAEQAALIRKKEISPVDLIDLYLDRIGKWDGVLHSWITVCADSARRQAKEAASRIRSPRVMCPPPWLRSFSRISAKA